MSGRPEVVERFVHHVEAAAFDRLADLYAEDVLLDAHVPDWRFQVRGADAVAEQLTSWFRPPGTFHELETEQTASGDLVVRFAWHEREGSAEAVVSRELQLWRLAGERITEQVVFCSGRWDVSLVERMAAEAPLVGRTTPPREEIGDGGTAAAVARFEAAFGRHDVDAVMAAMTDDCVFEDTAPPNGTRHEGRTAVRRCWERLFSASPEGVFDTEELVVHADRAVARWRYRWPQDGGGHVRGVDVFRVREGRVAEKLSYVKG